MLLHTFREAEQHGNLQVLLDARFAEASRFGDGLRCWTLKPQGGRPMAREATVAIQDRSAGQILLRLQACTPALVDVALGLASADCSRWSPT